MLHEVYLSLGSNLKDREKNCKEAVEALKRHERISLLSSSTMYESAPVGVTDQPDFINMAVRIETSLSPEELLAAVKGIEKQMGRKETVRWGPRLIDIDILLYGDKHISVKGLNIPHPRLLERAFVLLPLGEIAGKLEPSLTAAMDAAARMAQIRMDEKGTKRLI